MAYHHDMSTPTFEELEQALHRRGDPMSVEDFLGVLGEVAGHAEALSVGERDFLLKNTELDPEDLSTDARARAQLQMWHSGASAGKDVEAASLTTQEAAQLLGRAESNVRRSRLNGDLYAVQAEVVGRTLRFPRWQFTESATVVPGLRCIIPVLPGDFHPLDVEAFMTSPHEALEGRTPVQWLVTGGQVESVVKLADELGYQ